MKSGILNINTDAPSVVAKINNEGHFSFISMRHDNGIIYQVDTQPQLEFSKLDIYTTKSNETYQVYIPCYYPLDELENVYVNGVVASYYNIYGLIAVNLIGSGGYIVTLKFGNKQVSCLVRFTTVSNIDSYSPTYGSNYITKTTTNSLYSKLFSIPELDIYRFENKPIEIIDIVNKNIYFRYRNAAKININISGTYSGGNTPVNDTLKLSFEHTKIPTIYIDGKLVSDSYISLSGKTVSINLSGYAASLSPTPRAYCGGTHFVVAFTDGGCIYGMYELHYSSVSGTVTPHDNSSHTVNYITSSEVTYENLNANGDVGSGANQVAPGIHQHVEADITDLEHDAVKIQGTPVDNTPPADGNLLVYIASSDKWVPTELPPSPVTTHDLNGTDHNGITGSSGNLMALDSDGLPVDSGSSPSDFASSEHNHVVDDITDFPTLFTQADADLLYASLDGTTYPEFSIDKDSPSILYKFQPQPTPAALFHFENNLTDSAGRHIYGASSGTLAYSTTSGTFKFGSRSYRFTTTASISESPLQNQTDFTFYNTRWTCDFWVAFQNITGDTLTLEFIKDASNYVKLSCTNGADTAHLILDYNNGSGLVTINLSAAAVYTANTTHHIKFCSDGSKIYIFSDGVILNAGGTAISLPDLSAYTSHSIVGAGAGYKYIDELRFVPEFCEDTQTFNVPTAAYTTGTNGFNYSISNVPLTANRKLLFPNLSGTIAIVGHTHIASNITDFATAVAANTTVAANTRVRHTQNTDFGTTLQSFSIDDDSYLGKIKIIPNRNVSNTPNYATLLHLNNTLTDSCGRHLFSAATGTQYFTYSPSKFSKGSYYLYGTAYIAENPLQNQTDFTFGTTQWICDFWIAFSAIGAYSGYFYVYKDTTHSIRLYIEANTSTYIRVYYRNGSTTETNLSNTAAAWVANVFHHVCFSYDGSKIYMFIDGTLQNAGGTTVTLPDLSAYTTCQLRSAGNANKYYNEFRFVSGSSVTSNFTPPTVPYRGGSADKELYITNNVLSDDRTLTLPDNSGTFSLEGHHHTTSEIDGLDLSLFLTKADADLLYDPIGTASSELDDHTTVYNHDNYDTAYNWGDHSLVGYLTSETDPIFTSSPAFGISAEDIINWNAAYGWGNHAGLYDLIGTASSERAAHELLYDHSSFLTQAQTDLLYAALIHLHTQYLTTSEADALYAALIHSHADLYYTTSEIMDILQGYSVTGHNHNDLYYTETEIDNMLNAYYTTSEITNILLGYSQTGHTHSTSEITDFPTLFTKEDADLLYDTIGTASSLISLHTSELDPHPQYLTPAEADIVYAPIVHTHSTSDITNLDLSQYSLTGHKHDDLYDAIGTAESLIALHTSDLDPHPQYLTVSEADLLYADLVHTHSTSDITDLNLNLYALKVHNHGVSDITDIGTYYYTKLEVNNLLTEYYTTSEVDILLSGKANTVHTHGVSDITDIGTYYYSKLEINNLLNSYYTTSEITNILLGYSQTGHTHSTSEITDLDLSIYSQIGHSHSTSDILDLDLSIYSQVGHNHTITDITNLGDYCYSTSEIDTILLGYSLVGHTHPEYLTSETDPIFTASTAYGISSSDVSNWNSAYSWGNHAGLYDLLGAATSAINNHTSEVNPHPQYLTQSEADLLYAVLVHSHSQYLTTSDAALTYAVIGHNHDSSYYTQTQIDLKFSDYYTSSEVDVLLSGKANTSHTHSSSDIIDVNFSLFGDVFGPTGAVDNNIVIYDGITGKLIKDSGTTISAFITKDQTTPQTFVNGIPLLEESRVIDLRHELVDKKYVDDAVASLGTRFYALDSADATGYKETSLTASSGATATYVKSSLVDDDYVMGWISPTGATFTKMLAGAYDFNIFAAKTAGTKELRIYWKLYEYKTDTSEVLIATSNDGDVITTKERQRIYCVLTSDYIPAAGSRIIGKIYAAVGVSGSAPEITLYYEGDEDSHWEIPTNTEILAENFIARVSSVVDENIVIWDGSTGKLVKDSGYSLTNFLTTSDAILTYSQIGHTHVTSDIIDLDLSGYAPLIHNHNDLYYTTGEVTVFLSGKSDVGHTHADLYDPLGTASSEVSAHELAYNHTNYNTAYSWGDHSLAGYLTSETDPIFVASAAYGIDSGDISNWDNAYSWGDHALVGYLTSETDPVFSASAAFGITSTNISNWNSAYGWGNHAGLYDTIGTAAGLISDHTSEADPHTQYYNETRGDLRYSQLGHIHAQYLSTSDAALTYALIVHNHSTSDITDLDLSLYALANHNHDLTYAPISHSHTTSDISDFPELFTQADADLLYAIIGHTHDDRYYTENEINNLLNGYYTTSEVDAALALKSNTNHTHGTSDITDFPTLFTKTDADLLYSVLGHTHDDRYYTETEVNNLLLNYVQTSDTYTYVTYDNLNANGDVGTGATQVAAGNHNHTGVYANASHTHLTSDITDFPELFTQADADLLYAVIAHTHDDRYYTETEVDNLLLGYYTTSEVDILLAGYSTTGHTHTTSDITDLDLSNYALSDHTHTSIIDPNDNTIVSFTYMLDAVNYIKFSNASSSEYPIIESDGPGSDKGLQIKTAGLGSLLISNNNDDAVGALLELNHFTGSPANDDVVAQIRFTEDNDNQEKTIFSQIIVNATEVSSGDESGSMFVEVMRDGSSTEHLNMQDGFVNTTVNMNANMNFLDKDHTWSGMTFIATVDSNNVGIGGLLTLSTDGHWDTASNTGTATSGPLAIALESGTGSKRIMLLGTMRDDTWDWSLGDGQSNLLYLGEQGAISSTAPEGTGVQVQIIGYRLSNTKIYFNPQLTIAELS